METSLLVWFNKLQMNPVGISKQDNLLTVFVMMIFRCLPNVFGNFLTLNDWQTERIRVRLQRHKYSRLHHCPWAALDRQLTSSCTSYLPIKQSNF